MNKKEYADIFDITKKKYPELRNVNIELKFNNELFFTMRSIVKLQYIFNKKRKYAININIHKRCDVLSKLSGEDISARFAHEMAHIIEYEKMNNSELILFGLKYLYNKKFRFKVEKRVNAYAANAGFAKELIGVWKKLCSMKSISEKYKKYIQKNYKPEWSEIKEKAISLGVTKETYESI